MRAILPIDLSSFFFFEGEKNNEISRKDLGKSVRTLLGLEAFEKMRSHLHGPATQQAPSSASVMGYYLEQQSKCSGDKAQKYQKDTGGLRVIQYFAYVGGLVKLAYTNSQEYFEDFYDEIEISEKASMSHFKSAMQIRNKEMVDRSDLVICYIERNSGGAYQTIEYAKKQNKRIINLAEEIEEDN